MGKKDEFLSGIAKDEKFIPIITLVVYCGTEHGWDSDTREMLEVMANVKLSEEHNTMADREGQCNMLKAFEDMRLEGKIEGKMEQMIQLVCKKLRKNKTAEVIAEELEEEVEQIRKIIEAQKRAGSYDAEQICKIMIR